MGKLHTLLTSQVCMCGNPSFPSRKTVCLPCQSGQWVGSIWPRPPTMWGGWDVLAASASVAWLHTRRRKTTSFCQSENLFVWLVDRALRKQWLGKLTEQTSQRQLGGPSPFPRVPPSYVLRPPKEAQAVQRQRSTTSYKTAQALNSCVRLFQEQHFCWFILASRVLQRWHVSLSHVSIW